ncbi:hypothetical protein BRCON_1712 [Candidatus Sumerlaea chitinivorans]|uniref:Uncharacterized protein n=1 Tax=Sumerlaea chitinivorans TaxID=2250252 RepID=A0A2Z4Y6D8_SUMC1|nr:hypothetical protein BRCON_1712 [Candidatus Sumerlaea chitinivorans]
MLSEKYRGFFVKKPLPRRFTHARKLPSNSRLSRFYNAMHFSLQPETIRTASNEDVT